VFSSATVAFASSPQGRPGSSPDYPVACQIVLLLKSSHSLRSARPEIAVNAKRVAKIAQSLLDNFYVRTSVALTKRHAWIGGCLIARRLIRIRCRHWNCRSVVPAQDFLGAFVILNAVVEAVVTAVNALGDRLELLLVGKLVKPIQFPKLTGDAKPYFFGGSYDRIIHQIETEKVAILRIVRASGKLNGPSSFVALAIARLRVTQIFTAFISGTGSYL